MSIHPLDSRLEALCDFVRNHLRFIPILDQEYVGGWVAKFRKELSNGYFDKPIEERRNVEWNKYSFYRYDPFYAITGLLSELRTLVYINRNMKQLACVLAPDDEINQKAGIDLIVTYPTYTASVQAKTSEFSAWQPYKGALSRWVRVFDYFKEPAPIVCDYHRIAIIDEVYISGNQPGGILYGDYNLMRQCIMSSENGPIVWVNDVLAANPQARVANI